MTINHLGLGLAVKDTPVVDPAVIPAGLLSKAFLPVNVAVSISSAGDINMIIGNAKVFLDGKAEDLEKMSRYYAANGVTSFLAGSSSNLVLELRNLVAFGLPLEDALTAMTIAAAKAVRLDKTIGSIAVGKVADLLMLDEKLNLAAAYISGQKL